MKKLTFILLSTLFLTLITAQVYAATITVTTNTNWSALTGGTGSGGLPGSADIVIVQSAATLTVDLTNAVCGTLTLGVKNKGNGTLAFSAGGTSVVYVVTSLDVGGSGGTPGLGSINMNNGGTLQIGGTVTISAAGTWTPSTGTVEYNGAAQTLPTTFFTSYYNLKLSGSLAKTLPTAVTTINGNLTLSGTATATTLGALTIQGNLVVETGTTFATGATSTWTLGVTGTTSVTGTLTLANTGTKTFTGDVTVNSGGVWNETGIAAINFGGSLTNNATTFTASTGTHTFSGATKTLSGATTTSIGTVTFTGNYTNSATFTVGTLLTVTGASVTLTNNGTLTVTTALAGTGGLTNAAAGTLNINFTGAPGITTLTATASGNTVSYGYAGSQTIKATTYHHLTTGGGSGTKTLAGAVTVNGNLTIGASTTLDVSGSNYALNVAGNWVNSGTFTPQSGTVTLNGSGQTISGSTTFNNLTKQITLADVLTFAASSTQTISGTLTLNGAASAITRLSLRSSLSDTQWNITPQGSISVTWVDVKDSNVIGTTITTANSVNSLNNTNWIFALNYTGTVFTDEGSTNIGSGKTVSISINGGAVTSTTTDANGAYTLNTPANVDDSIVIYLDGNTEKGALVSRTAGSASGMDIYQNHVNLRGTGTVSNTNFTTAYNGDTDILYTVSGGNLTFTAGIEFLVWTGRTFQPGGNVTVENIDIRGTVIPEANTVNVSGNWDFSTGATFTAGTSTVNFTGASKTIGGTASTTFYNLTLNNSSGFTINNNITVDHTLTLTSGNLTTNAYILTISSTGTVSRTSGHIVGNLQKNVAAGTGVARTFEIGDASNYTPVDLTFATVGTAGNVTATTASGDHAEIGTSGLNSSLSVNRNWTLTNSSTVFTTYNATFTFVAGDLDGGATTGNFIVRRYNSGWSSTSTGTRTATTTQALGIADMGAFAIGESGAVTTKTLSEAITASWVEGTAYLYNGTQFVIYQYNDTTDIPAWEGFFAAVKADVNILIPASASPPAVSSPMTKTLTSGRYYLLSSPLISSIGGTAKANLSTGGLVAGDNTFGGLDKWRIYKRLYSDGAYYDGSAETFLPGRGFFVKQVYGVDKDISVSGSGASGNSGYYELKLPMNGGSAKTFHQIGNPFWYSIKWSDCKFSQSMDTLFPLGKIAGALPPEKTETCFVRLELVSSDGLALDTYNRAGVILTEGGNPDFFTASELTPPAPYVSLSLTDPSNQNRGALAYDFRTAGQKSYTWNVNMGTSYTSIDAALSIKEFTHVPEGMSFTLADEKTGESYTLTGDKTIPVSLGKDAVRTFVLTATLNEKPTVIETVTPKLFGITGIAPNPFNPTTTIYYNLAVSGTAKVCIYNLNGQLVETLVNGQVTAGSHTAVWNASMYASGIYFVRLESGRLQQSRKITFVK